MCDTHNQVFLAEYFYVLQFDNKLKMLDIADSIHIENKFIYRNKTKEIVPKREKTLNKKKQTVLTSTCIWFIIFIYF